METPLMFSAEWWQQPLGSWMAWNRVTIAFFLYVFGSIIAMGVWEYFSPGGSPRRFRVCWSNGRCLRVSAPMRGGAATAIWPWSGGFWGGRGTRGSGTAPSATGLPRPIPVRP